MVGDFAKAPSGQRRFNRAISCEFILRHLFLRQQCCALKGSSTQLKTKGLHKEREDLCMCQSHKIPCRSFFSSVFQVCNLNVLNENCNLKSGAYSHELFS
jgi:hypothetical protein